MTKITLTLDDLPARTAFTALLAAGADMSPLLKGLGETLLASTKARFAQGVGPDGQRWAPNKDSTLLGLLGKYKSSFGKRGKITKKGAQRAASKRPLIGETRQLSTQINYRVLGPALEVGSPMIYASVQQFGATRGKFGSTKRGAPIPWGTIPARPFLGVSLRDRAEIDAQARAYLASVLTRK